MCIVQRVSDNHLISGNIDKVPGGWVGVPTRQVVMCHRVLGKINTVLKDRPTGHKKVWSVKTGGLWWQIISHGSGLKTGSLYSPLSGWTRLMPKISVLVREVAFYEREHQMYSVDNFGAWRVSLLECPTTRMWRKKTLPVWSSRSISVLCLIVAVYWITSYWPDPLHWQTVYRQPGQYWGKWYFNLQFTT